MRRSWYNYLIPILVLFALVSGGTVALLWMAWKDSVLSQSVSVPQLGDGNRVLMSLLGVRTIEAEVEIPEGKPFLLVTVALIKQGKIVQVPLNAWMQQPGTAGEKVKIGVYWGQIEGEWKAVAYTGSRAFKVTNPFFQHLDGGSYSTFTGYDLPVAGYYVAGVATSLEGEGQNGEPEFPSNTFALNDYGLFLLAGFYPDRATLNEIKFNRKRQIRKLQEGFGHLIDPAQFVIQD